MTLRKKFERWALDNNKPYDRMVPWSACELAFYAAYRMALTDFAEHMDRANQPAAAIGALLLRDRLEP